jgi:glycosyltransferase involved in cell wall biosynthesis
MLRLQGFEHLRIWPRGVDTTLFHPERRNISVRNAWLQARNQPENKTVILYVGRVSWEKNLNLLVQAYQTMNHEQCHLVIVGDGPAHTELQQKLAGLPVTFTGYLTGEALATAYASADVFAFPSYTETFGQAVLEAMSCGLPVVGLLSEGVCDLVDHENTGLLLNIQQLAEKEKVAAYSANLTLLVHNHQLRQQMSQASLVEAQKRSWYEAMEKLVKGYQEVIETARVLVAA